MGGSKTDGSGEGGSRRRGLFDHDPDKFLLDEDVSIVTGDDFDPFLEGSPFGRPQRSIGAEATTENVHTPPPGPSYTYDSAGPTGGAGVFDEGYRGEAEAPTAEQRKAYFDSVMRAKAPGKGSASAGSARALGEQASRSGERMQVGRPGQPLASDDMSAAFSDPVDRPPLDTDSDTAERDFFGAKDPSDLPRSRLDTEGGDEPRRSSLFKADSPFGTRPPSDKPRWGEDVAATARQGGRGSFGDDPDPVHPDSGGADDAAATGSAFSRMDFNTAADEEDAVSRISNPFAKGGAGHNPRRPAGAVPSMNPSASSRRFSGLTWVALIAMLVALGAMAFLTWRDGAPDWQGALADMTGQPVAGTPAPDAAPVPPDGADAAQADPPLATQPEAQAASPQPASAEPAAALAVAKADPPPAPAADDAASSSVDDRRSAALGTGAVVIQTDRSARVYVDGEAAGQTPMSRLTLPVGQHTIKLVPLQHGKAISRKVRVDAGRAAQVAFSWGD